MGHLAATERTGPSFLAAQGTGFDSRGIRSCSYCLCDHQWTYIGDTTGAGISSVPRMSAAWPRGGYGIRRGYCGGGCERPPHVGMREEAFNCSLPRVRGRQTWGPENWLWSGGTLLHPALKGLELSGAAATPLFWGQPATQPATAPLIRFLAGSRSVLTSFDHALVEQLATPAIDAATKRSMRRGPPLPRRKPPSP